MQIEADTKITDFHVCGIDPIEFNKKGETIKSRCSECGKIKECKR